MPRGWRRGRLRLAAAMTAEAPTSPPRTNERARVFASTGRLYGAPGGAPHERHGRPQPAHGVRRPLAGVRVPRSRDRSRRVRRGADRLHGLPFPGGRRFLHRRARRLARRQRRGIRARERDLPGGRLAVRTGGGRRRSRGAAGPAGVPDRLDGHPHRRGRDRLRLGTARQRRLPRQGAGAGGAPRGAGGVLSARPARRGPLRLGREGLRLPGRRAGGTGRGVPAGGRRRRSPCSPS